MGLYSLIATVAMLLTMGVAAGAMPDGDRPAASVLIVLPDNAGPVLKNIGAVFARQVQQRCEAKVLMTGDAPLKVELAVQPGIGTEGFTIADGKAGTVRIVGNDQRGVLYGVGKFLRSSRYDQGGFTPGAGAGRRCRRSRCAASTLPPTSTTSITMPRSRRSSGTWKTLASGDTTR